MASQNEKPKSLFVYHMNPMITYMFDDIQYLNYYVDKENGEEFVKVYFKYDSKYVKEHPEKPCLDICVTADSLHALLQDVLKALYKIV